MAVAFDVEVYETVEQAAETFEEQMNRYNANEFSVGDEAFWAERPDNARAIVRQSNAVGAVIAVRESGGERVPDISRAQTYAEEMVAHWESV